MKTHIKLFLTCLLVCFCFADALGQSRVRVFREKDKNNEKDYIVFADNPTGKRQHVVVIFDDLVGYIPSIRKPPSINIGIGRSKLFKLKRDELSSQANFQFRSYSYPGVANPKITKIEFALPIKSGEKVLVKRLKANGALGQNSSGKEFYGLAFYGNSGETIYAVRAGRVTKVNETGTGSIEVDHADGTIGRYSSFQITSLMVKEGDEILAGDQLALFSERGLQFSQRYLFYEYKEGVRNTNWYAFRYLIPKFRTEKGLQELKSDNNYTAVLTSDMVTQEMTRRERKNYLKNKK